MWTLILMAPIHIHCWDTDAAQFSDSVLILLLLGVWWCLACEQESISAVELLLAFGAAVNQRCYRGWTALHETARRGNAALCETLLRARATVDARNADDITPAIEAARHGCTEALAHLIRRGTQRRVYSIFWISLTCSHLRLSVSISRSSSSLFGV